MNGLVRGAVIVAVLLSLLTLPAGAAEPLSGTFTLDRNRSDDVNAAINSVVKKMNPLTRSVARRRLRNTNPAYPSVAISFTDDHARISAGPSTVTLPLSGRPILWKRAGEMLTVTGRRDGNRYVETFDAKDGRRTNVFTPTSDGLVMSVTVTSRRLPQPLQYRLVYIR